MFKDNGVEKLIDYIKTLPDEQRELIATKVSIKKKGKTVKGKKVAKNKMQAFADYIEKLPSRLPKNYKFDREEANER